MKYAAAVTAFVILLLTASLVLDNPETRFLWGKHDVGPHGQIAKAESNQTSTNQSNSTTIDNKDLLQADATIMAGILILLTVTSIKGGESLLAQYSLIGFTPFALSAMLLIMAGIGNLPTSWIQEVLKLSRILIIIGPVFLIGVLLGIAVYSYLNSKRRILVSRSGTAPCITCTCVTLKARYMV